MLVILHEAVADCSNRMKIHVGLVFLFFPYFVYAEEEEVRCPEGQENGLFPHPTTCSKFLSCKDGVATIQVCPHNLVFNPRLGVCDYSYRVNCTSEIITELPETTSITTEPPIRCSGMEFYCGNQQCIPLSKSCDGKVDCSNEFDEQGCDKYLLEYVKHPTTHCLLTKRQILFGLTLKGCARYCYENRFYKCRTFVQESQYRSCYFMESVPTSPSDTLQFWGADLYVEVSS